MQYNRFNTEKVYVGAVFSGVWPLLSIVDALSSSIRPTLNTPNQIIPVTDEERISFISRRAAQILVRIKWFSGLATKRQNNFLYGFFRYPFYDKIFWFLWNLKVIWNITFIIIIIIIIEEDHKVRNKTINSDSMKKFHV